MKIQNFPDIDLPTVTVTASLPGASPAQLETEVARKIENSVATVQGVKHIYTKVQDGTAIITVEFRLEKPTQEAVDDVRDAVSRVRSDLPADLRDPVITKMELAGMPILTYTVASARMDDEALSWFVDNKITKAMLGGARRRRGLARGRCDARSARRARPGAAAGAERDRGRHLAAVAADPAGSLRRAHRRRRRRAVGAHASPRCSRPTSWARMEIALSDGRRIRLDQVATVTDTVAEPRSAALLNGKRGGRLRGRARARRRRGRRGRRRARASSSS